MRGRWTLLILTLMVSFEVSATPISGDHTMPLPRDPTSVDPDEFRKARSMLHEVLKEFQEDVDRCGMNCVVMTVQHEDRHLIPCLRQCENNYGMFPAVLKDEVVGKAIQREVEIGFSNCVENGELSVEECEKQNTYSNFKPKREGLYFKMEPLFKGALRKIGEALNRVQGPHTPSGWVAPDTMKLVCSIGVQ